MKRNLLRLPVLLCTVATLGACSSANHLITDRENNLKKGKENNAACFIQKKDGSVQQYNSLRLVTGLFTAPHLLADGNIRIEANEITAYQNADHYAVAPSKLENARKSKVAVESLPGFAVRIAKGNLNVYCKKYYNGAKAVDELYVQEGEDGRILPYSDELFQALLKKNPEAAALFQHKRKPASVLKKMQVVAEVYNKGQLYSKN
ncbi:MAG: hypothetical protein EOO03_01240 [Chitinophagaceae bacterium]|nr:MAG: hypothetical protein EOO03_01240 [Chitinophagaceae bacterium]